MSITLLGRITVARKPRDIREFRKSSQNTISRHNWWILRCSCRALARLTYEQKFSRARNYENEWKTFLVDFSDSWMCWTDVADSLEFSEKLSTSRSEPATSIHEEAPQSTLPSSSACAHARVASARSARSLYFYFSSCHVEQVEWEIGKTLQRTVGSK